MVVTISPGEHELTLLTPTHGDHIPPLVSSITTVHACFFIFRLIFYYPISIIISVSVFSSYIHSVFNRVLLVYLIVARFCSFSLVRFFH